LKFTPGSIQRDLRPFEIFFLPVPLREQLRDDFVPLLLQILDLPGSFHPHCQDSGGFFRLDRLHYG